MRRQSIPGAFGTKHKDLGFVRFKYMEPAEPRLFNPNHSPQPLQQDAVMVGVKGS